MTSSWVEIDSVALGVRERHADDLEFEAAIVQPWINCCLSLSRKTGQNFLTCCAFALVIDEMATVEAREHVEWSWSG
jgi:hypothetical protein